MQEMKEMKTKPSLPKTGSLEVLLSQYLETGDYVQIDNVLNVDDKKVCIIIGFLTGQVVQSTVQRIEAKNVLPLLNILVMKLEANSRVWTRYTVYGQRGNTLLVWIRYILQYHSSYLMSIPELHKKLSFLRHLLDMRSSSYKRLMKLRGRIDLVLTHARSVTRDDIDFSKAQIPLLEVNDGTIEEEGEESQEIEEESSEKNSIDSDLNDSYDEEEEEMNSDDDDNDEDILNDLLQEQQFVLCSFMILFDFHVYTEAYLLRYRQDRMERILKSHDSNSACICLITK